MELKDLKIGMPVRYENQKWKGIVIDFDKLPAKHICMFGNSGAGMDELIYVGYLRPF